MLNRKKHVGQQEWGRRLRAILDAKRNRRPLKHVNIIPLAAAIIVTGLVVVIKASEGVSRASETSTRVIQTAQEAVTQQVNSPEYSSRVLHFPEDRSLGKITVRDADEKGRHEDFHYWYHGEDLGEAQGDVVTPAGKAAALFLYGNAFKDLSPLLNLNPNDLYMLSHMSNISYLRISDKCILYIAHLTGLKRLSLHGIVTTTEGVKNITKLQSLERLQLPKGLTNKGLSHVAQLKSLKRLCFNENRKVTNSALNRYLPQLSKLEELAVGGDRISDAGLARLAELPLLRYLSLNSGNFTDAGMAHVRKCLSLRVLDLNHLPITDKGLSYLSGHPALEDLSLYNTRVSDRGLVYLKSLPSLKKLATGTRASQSPITDKGMIHLAEIKSLEHLQLPNRGVTDQGLAYIAKLDKLKYLWVGCSSNSPLTDTALKHVSELASLEELRIRGNGFTDGGMDHLAKLTRLRKLRLGGGSISDDGITKLAALRSLERLDLSCVNITISGLSQLNGLKNLVRLQVEGIKQDNSGLDISGLTKLEELDFEPGSLSRRQKLVLRDEDLACLAKLENLKELYIGRPSEQHLLITDAGMVHLAGLTNMRFLSIHSPHLTDKTLSYLNNMEQLRYLTLNGHFTDEGLHHLESLKSLVELELGKGSVFTPVALERLRKNLPNLQQTDLFETTDRRPP